MKDSIESAGTVIKSVAALIALFPGIAVLLGLVDIPPSLADLVKVISFSVSGIVLIAVFLLSDRVARLSKERVALYSIAAVLLGAACATGYFRFANAHTVIEDLVPAGTERHIIPLNPSPEIRRLVDRVQGDYKMAVQTLAERRELTELMKRESGSSMVIMILLLVLSEVLLIAPVVAAAWRLAGAPGSRAATEDDPATAAK